MSNDSIGDRMKRYEEVSKYSLTPKSCLFIRVDGKAFHTFTRSFTRPFDMNLINAMVYAAERTSENMQGFKGAYVQSDECTFMLTDFDTLQTQGWFGYELNKIISISASLYTAYFNQYLVRNLALGNKPPALFDSRAFTVPQKDAPNVFVWRQKDWLRNSIQMLAQTHFSQKQLHAKSTTTMREMLLTKNVDWAKLENQLKYGTFIFPSGVRNDLLNYSELEKELFSGVTGD